MQLRVCAGVFSLPGDLRSQKSLSPVARRRPGIAAARSDFSAREFEAAPRESDDLALPAVLAAFALVLGLDGFLADLTDHSHHVVGLVDGVEEFLVVALEELEERPDGDVLEGGVVGVEEAGEVAVDAAGRLVPRLEEEGVVADCEC